MQFDTTMTDISPSASPWPGPAAVTVTSPRRATLRSAKRPRSPSPLDNQHLNKRVMFARGQHRRTPSGERSDLLARTNSLSIRSSEEAQNVPSCPPGSDNVMDEDMMIDSPPRVSVSKRLNGGGLAGPHLALVIPEKPQTVTAGAAVPIVAFTNPAGSGSHVNNSHHHLQLPASMFASSSHSYNNLPNPSASLMVPRINVQPATPESVSRATSMAPPSPLASSSPLNPQWSPGITAVSMAWSLGPPSPGPFGHAPATPKKRITMGPRADCVKCQQGVKGHGMHFD